MLQGTTQKCIEAMAQMRIESGRISHLAMNHPGFNRLRGIRPNRRVQPEVSDNHALVDLCAVFGTIVYTPILARLKTFEHRKE